MPPRWDSKELGNQAHSRHSINTYCLNGRKGIAFLESILQSEHFLNGHSAPYLLGLVAQDPSEKLAETLWMSTIPGDRVETRLTLFGKGSCFKLQSASHA